MIASGNGSSRQAMAARTMRNALMGVVTTALTAAALGLGWLAPLERVAHDQRTRWFAHHTPRPSPAIVHIDIDDASLARTGRWPWPRTYLANVTAELTRAGAKVIAFDLLLDEPQPPRVVLADDQDPADRSPEVIQDDRALARAIAAHGNVVLAVRTGPTDQADPISRRVVEALTADLDLPADQLRERLDLDAEAARRVDRSLATLRARAAGRAIVALRRELGRLPTFDECRAALLPGLPDTVRQSPALNILQQQLAQQRALAAVRRRLPDTDRRGGDWELAVPIAPLAQAAAAIGTVDYEADPDGVNRSLPLWVLHEGKRLPHFALITACRYLGVPIERTRVLADRTIVPEAGADGNAPLVLPMIQARPGDGWELFTRRRLLISWPTTADRWENLLDPRMQRPVNHLPIGPLVEMNDLRRDVADNRRAADAALAGIVTHDLIGGLFPADVAARLTALLADDAEPTAQQRAAVREPILETARFVLADFQGLENPSEEERQLRQTIERGLAHHEQAVAAARRGAAVVAEYERELRDQVDGAICMIGWTATGSLADFVPTAVGGRTPGVVVHAAVVNAILTGHLIDRADRWVDLAVTVAMGLLATLIAARFAPISALAMIVALVAGGFAFSGMVLLDRMNLLVAAAGPTVAAVLAWAGITFYRLVIEQRERARITRQFKNYVSRDLVDLLVANPKLIKQGEHELTIMFSDIAGFTTIAEQLGTQRTIGLLNDYLSEMTRRLMTHRGTVNKYLGDGIMAFWNAPLDDEQHTLNACTSVLECIGAMKRFDQDPRFADLPRLFMRVGIATGPVVVGDCGAPPQRSDYTVIGNTANLAARLESANKQFDTQILINDRARELVAPHMLTRPIGRIQVVGTTIPELVHELLSTWDAADDQQRRKAKLTTAMVDAYVAGDFGACVGHAQALAAEFGTTKLAELYRATCREFIERGVPDDFTGALVLTQK